MLILGGLVLTGQNVVALNLSDDRQAVDDVSVVLGGDGAAFGDLSLLFALRRRRGAAAHRRRAAHPPGRLPPRFCTLPFSLQHLLPARIVCQNEKNVYIRRGHGPILRG